MQPNFYGTLTSSTPNYTVSSGFITALYDTGGKQNVTVQSGGSLALLGASGNNTITLHGNAADWKASQDNSTAIFIHTSGDRVEIPAILDAQTIAFADKSAQLLIDTTIGQTAAVKLGTQVLTTTNSALTAWDNSGNPVDPSDPLGSTVKVPWSLVMSTMGYSKDILVSDGTANGTHYLNAVPSYGDYYTNIIVTTPNCRWL